MLSAVGKSTSNSNCVKTLQAICILHVMANDSDAQYLLKKTYAEWYKEYPKRLGR